jgi:membrane protease YdiL (CAAX protease family)
VPRRRATEHNATLDEVAQLSETQAPEQARPSLRSLVVVVLILFAVVTVWPFAGPLVKDMGWPVRLAVSLSPYLVIVAVLVVAARLGHLSVGKAFGWSTEHLGRQLLTGLALLAITLSLTLLPALFGVGVLGDGETRPLAFLYVAFRTFVMVGFVEEFAWRGFVLNGARAALRSKTWSIVVSSVLFGLWHYPGGQDVLQVLVTALIGALYATARLTVRGCTTLATGTAHGLHDLALLTLASLSI